MLWPTSSMGFKQKKTVGLEKCSCFKCIYSEPTATWSETYANYSWLFIMTTYSIDTLISIQLVIIISSGCSLYIFKFCQVQNIYPHKRINAQVCLVLICPRALRLALPPRIVSEEVASSICCFKRNLLYHWKLTRSYTAYIGS